MKNIILPALLFFSWFSLNAQVNTDSLFTSAIKHAKEKAYNKAIENAKAVLAIDNNRSDVMVFVANVYGWKGDYNNALNYIEQANKINPTDKELYDSWLNILLWSKNYEKLLETLQTAESNNYPDTYNVLLKKLIAHKALGKYSEGITIAENHPELLDSAQIRALYNEMYMANRSRQLSVFYGIDLFEKNNPLPQHLAYIDYAFKINKHTLITRFNYANRFNTDDYQAEVDYYHVFKNGHYLYANYGYGIKKELFPFHRAGLEYYLPFAKSFEASFGGRILNNETTNVIIATGHVGKYFSKSWLAFRPFYVFHEKGNAITSVLSYRLYGGNPANFWGIELAYGNSPDDRYVISQLSDISRLKSYRIKLEKSLKVLRTNEIKLSAGYAHEEFFSSLFRNRYNFELIYKHRF